MVEAIYDMYRTLTFNPVGVDIKPYRWDVIIEFLSISSHEPCTGFIWATLASCSILTVSVRLSGRYRPPPIKMELLLGLKDTTQHHMPLRSIIVATVFTIGLKKSLYICVD